MNYTLFAVKDNAEAQLDSGIGAATLSIILKSGKGALFPQPYSGTTTSGGTSTTLNKTGIGASGIAVGDFIENTTDGSHAFVSVVSADSLTTTTLVGGSDNTWQNADGYRVNSFVITLNKRDTNGNITAYEKVKIIARSGDSLTVDPSGRGYDSSTPQSFAADDYCDIFILSKQHDELRKAFAEMAEQMDLKASIVYVQSSMQARTWKDPVVVATTGAGTLATSFANGQSVDGYTLVTGDRILLKNQASPIENGIYVVAASGAPARATDFDSPSEVTGAGVSVIKGTSNADTVWICTADSPTIGVNNITFSQIGASITKAVQAESEAGSDDVKYMTPLQTVYAINKFAASAVWPAIYAADAQANDTYVITLSPAPAAYVTGMMINFKANTINTGAATLNVNSLGAKTIKRNYNLDLVDGDIKANQICTVIYDGTNFQLLNPNAQNDTAGKVFVFAHQYFAKDAGVTLAYAGTGETPVLQFPDAATNYARFVVEIPAWATSIASIKVSYQATATTGTVEWVQTVGYWQRAAGTGSIDNNGAFQDVVFTGTTGQNYQYTMGSDNYNGLTIAGGGFLSIKVGRNGNAGADTYAGAANIIGLEVTFA